MSFICNLLQSLRNFYRRLKEVPQKSCPHCRSGLISKDASISLLLLNGNEETVSVYYCPKCQKYYMRGFEDVFIGEPDYKIWSYGSFSEEKGEEMIKQIKSCPNPFDKHCDCPAHAYFMDIFYKRN